MSRLTRLFVIAFGAFGALVPPAARAVPAPSTSVDAPVIAAVGDIACKNPPGNNVHLCQYDDVSNLIAGHGYDAFLALGDEQYEYGRKEDFIQNYDAFFVACCPSRIRFLNHEWGRPTRPATSGTSATSPECRRVVFVRHRLRHAIALNSVSAARTPAPHVSGQPEYRG
jgi:hypothetical protein